MEAEQQGMSYIIQNQQELKQIIVATYRGQTQDIINQAQSILSKCFNCTGFVQSLAKIICTCNHEEGDIKKAATVLLKKISYDLSHTLADKSAFIETIFNLITHEQLEINIKKILGDALESQFNQSENDEIKKLIKAKILQRFNNQEAIAIFDSCILIFQAYFNSLLTESEEMLDFFTEIIQPVCAAALQIYQMISKMPNHQWVLSEHIIVSKLSLLFEFLFVALNHLIEEKDDLEEGLVMIRKNRFLIVLFESYLLLFNNNRSIVSSLCPSTNKLKSKITNTIQILYQEFQCPQKMFHIIFTTVILQSQKASHDKVVQEILINCLKIVSAHLDIKVYAQVFKQHKIQFIFSLLMYSVTSKEQYYFIENDPQVFVQQSQQFTEGIGESYHLKSHAASTIQLFADRIDEAPKSILQIIMVIISESIAAQNLNPNFLKEIQDHFSQFPFYNLAKQQKLQTCLMVLCVLSNHINKRQEMNKSIYGFFLTNFQIIKNIQSPIVILRIIRAISYFPSPLYFYYIQMQMARGKAFVLQGIKSLERILRNNRNPQLFNFLSSIFSKIMISINVTDPVMELIVINYYDTMLKPNPQLYTACRAKIRQQFFVNVFKNPHPTLICLNLLQSLIRKQQNGNDLVLVQKQFYEISAFIQTEQHKQLYDYYEQKLIQIYQSLLKKYGDIKPQMENFANNSLRHLHLKQKGSRIFNFYNNYLSKLMGRSQILKSYFYPFWEQIKHRFQLFLERRQSFEAIPYFCFLISQIIASNCGIIFGELEYIKLMEMGQKLPKDEKQYPIIVFLTLLFVNPVDTLTFLKTRNIYNFFLTEITKIKYQGVILKKIFNLAYVSILQFEKDPSIIKQVVIQSITNLKQLNSQTFKKQQKKNIEIKPRRYADKPEDSEFQFKRQKALNDNQLINLFVKFKHPLENISEFDLFKTKFWGHNYLAKDLAQPIKSDLRMLMEIEMVQSKARIIRKVKK